MARGDKIYFENFAASAAISKKAADYLVDCLEKYDPDNAKQMLIEMHEIEHSADKKKHEMGELLAKAFVTPLDREDLDLLSHKLDDVTDSIEAVLQKLYMYNISTIQPEVVDFAKKIVRGCELICEIMGEFETFRKSKKIRPLIIELYDVEEDCDNFYLRTMHALTKSSDVMSVIAWREVYASLETCADACENVGESITSVILKNT